MKKIYFTVLLLLCCCFCSCGIFVDLNTPKSAELSEKYDFYEKSVASIRVYCNVTPEESDEIFIMLVKYCDISERVNYITKSNDGSYSFSSSGKTYIFTLKDNVVSTIVQDKFLADDIQLYPEPSPTLTPTPTLIPTPKPTSTPTPEPTPTLEPTFTPTPEPTPTPTSKPEDKGSNFNTYDNEEQQNTKMEYVLNTSSKKIHYPTCRSVKKIAPKNYSTSNLSIAELEKKGYSKCGICFK